MTWVLRDPIESLGLALAVGVRTMQLGCPPDGYDPERKEEFKELLRKSGIKVTTVFCGYAGENYSTLETTKETVGLRNPKFREERVRKTFEVSDFAKEIGVNAIAAHIGFVPEDREDPLYGEIVETMRKIADYCKGNGQFFALETGQETARTLLRFIKDVGRDNVRVNFDPANMLFYGSGDPIEALEVLKDYVIGVHCKDARREGGRLVEVPFGEGEVGAERFLRKLVEIGYKGPLTIERELEDPEEQRREMARIKVSLEKLRDKVLSTR
ncbi:MAG: TIM barrel protein [Candidatus Brockarchaeota archaeon]|nr:TIM barrel protein [Candidatus Brockarchaeota archaeon]